MFKYRVVKEIPKEFGYIRKVMLKTKDKKELQAKIPNIDIKPKIPNIDIKQIEDKIRQAWSEDRDKLRNLPMSNKEVVSVTYSVYEMRISLDELTFLEIEYYPFHPLKKTIENKIKKTLNVSINEKIILSESKKRNRFVLKKYLHRNSEEKGKQISLFTTTNSQIVPYLKALIKLSERWRKCND